MTDTGHTSLGTPELHKRHSVLIEGGPMPRSRVLSQTRIDKLLMAGSLSLAQHQAGEHCMSQYSLCAPRGINWGGIRVSGGKRDHIPWGSIPFNGTLAMVKKRLSWFHMLVLKEVIVNDLPVHQNIRLSCLKAALDLVADQRMGGGSLRRLDEATKKFG